jgi:hypothetical protein
LLIRLIDTVHISIAHAVLADASRLVSASVPEASIAGDAVVAAAKLVAAERAVRVAIAELQARSRE